MAAFTLMAASPRYPPETLLANQTCQPTHFCPRHPSAKGIKGRAQRWSSRFTDRSTWSGHTLKWTNQQSTRPTANSLMPTDKALYSTKATAPLCSTTSLLDTPRVLPSVYCYFSTPSSPPIWLIPNNMSSNSTHGRTSLATSSAEDLETAASAPSTKTESITSETVSAQTSCEEASSQRVMSPPVKFDKEGNVIVPPPLQSLAVATGEEAIGDRGQRSDVHRRLAIEQDVDPKPISWQDSGWCFGGPIDQKKTLGDPNPLDLYNPPADKWRPIQQRVSDTAFAIDATMNAWEKAAESIQGKVTKENVNQLWKILRGVRLVLPHFFIDQSDYRMKKVSSEFELNLDSDKVHIRDVVNHYTLMKELRRCINPLDKVRKLLEEMYPQQTVDTLEEWEKEMEAAKTKTQKVTKEKQEKGEAAIKQAKDKQTKKRKRADSKKLSQEMLTDPVAVDGSGTKSVEKQDKPPSKKRKTATGRGKATKKSSSKAADTNSPQGKTPSTASPGSPGEVLLERIKENPFLLPDGRSAKDFMNPDYFKDGDHAGYKGKGKLSMPGQMRANAYVDTCLGEHRADTVAYEMMRLAEEGFKWGPDGGLQTFSTCNAALARQLGWDDNQDFKTQQENAWCSNYIPREEKADSVEDILDDHPLVCKKWKGSRKWQREQKGNAQTCGVVDEELKKEKKPKAKKVTFKKPEVPPPKPKPQPPPEDLSCSEDSDSDFDFCDKDDFDADETVMDF